MRPSDYSSGLQNLPTAFSIRDFKIQDALALRIATEVTTHCQIFRAGANDADESRGSAHTRALRNCAIRSRGRRKRIAAIEYETARRGLPAS